MKWSADEVEEEPLGVVTTTSTVPEACGGAVAVIQPSDWTVKLAAVPPNVTPVAPVKPEPVTLTTVPPEALPEVRLRAVTDGAEAAV